MVSFVCDSCQETLKKSKIEKHLGNKCSNASFSCVDCNRSFNSRSYKEHNECNGSRENVNNQPKKHKQDILQSEHQQKVDFFSNPVPVSDQIKATPTPPPTPKKDPQPQNSSSVDKPREILKILKQTEKRVSLKKFRKMIKKTDNNIYKLWKTFEKQMEVTYDDESHKYILKSHSIR